MREDKIYAWVEYEDKYVQPIIVSALRSELPPDSFELVDTLDQISHDEDNHHPRILQFRAYEAIDFEYGLRNPQGLFNAYIIRKALIRKHYLSHTVHSWVTKHSASSLRRHVKPAVEFELDYAEFLDDALLEAYELTESFALNEGKPAHESEWWILKPSMSDRGQGIRLFRSEDGLRAIFEQWEAENPDSADEDEEEAEAEESDKKDEDRADNNKAKEYIMTSHLRHFVAQPYIDPPLLIASAPYSSRKFHVRTYVVAAGALKVYVYSHMLALFASQAYQPPWETEAASDSSLASHDNPHSAALLEKFRNIHLTNTCVQASSSSPTAEQNAEEAVFLLSSLPLAPATHTSIVEQINDITASLFRAAAAQPTNFQPLPQAFEIFGVDFLVERNATLWLLEVNAFPDFAQTGPQLRDLVVGGLFRAVFGNVIGPYFGLASRQTGTEQQTGALVEVLNLDLGRR